MDILDARYLKRTGSRKHPRWTVSARERRVINSMTPAERQAKIRSH